MPLKHLVGSLLHKSLAQSGRGYELIYSHYFSQLEHSNEIARLARSSYCEARDKISWEAYAYLLDQSKLENQTDIPIELWKGHRARAVDGSCVQLPRTDEILTAFPARTGGYGESYYPSANIFVAADIFTTQPTHATIENRFSSERESLKNLLGSFGQGDISILDRGLDGKKIWETFSDTGQFFVGRLRSRGAARLVFNENSKDLIIEVKVDRDKTLSLRVIRGAKFKTGTSLFLITNLLDQKKYPRKEILDLYKKRQAVEDVFLNLKNALHAKNIRSKKINGVLQEIYAALCMTSIAAGIRYLFERNLKNKRISFKSICWRLETKIEILMMPLSAEHLNLFIVGLWDFTHQIQPGRSYPRFSHQPPNKWINEKRKKTHLEKARRKKS